MTKIRIFQKMLTKEQVTALMDLVREAGYDPQDIARTDWIGAPNPDCDDEVVLIMATPATCSLPDLEKEMAKAMNGACRLIWVWPQNEEAAALPEPTKKYSYSIIAWDAEKLSAVAADDDVTCFELPTGQPIPKPNTERNLCVEETKKTK